jgi:aconitate hydratase
VVAYALAGSLAVDLLNDPLGEDADGTPVYLRDIWPANDEIRAILDDVLTPEMFRNRYSDVSTGPEEWQAIETTGGMTYSWQENSTYVRLPPFFSSGGENGGAGDILGARPLAILGDSVTTDHISPAGSIVADSPAGAYLISHGVEPQDFNSYGARRGNHEVMMRGTFANIRIKNEMAPGTEGGVTRHIPSGETLAIYDAAVKYQAEGVPLVVVGGKEYGSGSSRDWAAKGPLLLGVKAVIVERIHRSNLVGMGMMPLQFKDGQDRKSLGLDGSETFDIIGIADSIEPGMDVACRINRADGGTETMTLKCRIDTLDEVEYYKAGGILQHVLANLARAA